MGEKLVTTSNTKARQVYLYSTLQTQGNSECFKGAEKMFSCQRYKTVQSSKSWQTALFALSTTANWLSRFNESEQWKWCRNSWAVLHFLIYLFTAPPSFTVSEWAPPSLHAGMTATCSSPNLQSAYFLLLVTLRTLSLLEHSPEFRIRVQVKADWGLGGPSGLKVWCRGEQSRHMESM